MLKSMPALLAALSAVIGFVGIYYWIADQFRKQYKAPLQGVGPAAYRLLERARTRLFGRSRGVRFTIFAIDPEDPSCMRPIARLGPGRAAADSNVRFKRGQGLAGKAWAEDAFMAVKLGPFQSTEEARDANKRLLSLPDETVDVLSKRQLSAQALIAAPLHVGTSIKGVLCVDCFDEKLLPVHTGDKRNKEFWLELFRVATNLSTRIDFKPEISDLRVDTLPGGSLWEVKAA